MCTIMSVLSVSLEVIGKKDSSSVMTEGEPYMSEQSLTCITYHNRNHFWIRVKNYVFSVTQIRAKTHLIGQRIFLFKLK